MHKPPSLDYLEQNRRFYLSDFDALRLGHLPMPLRHAIGTPGRIQWPDEPDPFQIVKAFEHARRHARIFKGSLTQWLALSSDEQFDLYWYCRDRECQE